MMAVEVNDAIRIISLIFGVAVIGFQFVMACSLIIQGYNENKTRTPFDNSMVDAKLLQEQGYLTDEEKRRRY